MTVLIDVRVISSQIVSIYPKLMGTECTIMDDEFPKIAFMPLGQSDILPWPSWTYYCSFMHLKISGQFSFIPNGVCMFRWISLGFL